MPVDAQTNRGGSAAHAQWFSHQKIRADNHDVIIWFHKDLMQQWEGTIKGDNDQASGLLLLLLSGCFDTSVWVF